MFLNVAPSHDYFSFLFFDKENIEIFCQKSLDVSLDFIIDFFQIVCILKCIVCVENIFEWY